ncbi:adenosine kinase [Babesia caballi]|uniref:Adenosine kinase n=1 Tax=Babesia caballi TaxID=5871 RepID=A0AAV4M2Q6_BABCB|nr:adenosine kinase [Babesia caballi]
MNSSSFLAAVFGVFAAFASYASCKEATGEEIIEKGPTRILITGHPMVDQYARVDQSVVDSLNFAKGESNGITPETFKALGERVKVESRNAGGSAGNTARAYAYLGGAVTFFGVCGDDDISRDFSKTLVDYGVEDVTMRVPGLFTSQLYSLVTPDAERTMYLLFGASHTLKADYLNPAIMDDFEYYGVNGFMFANEDQVEFTHKMIDAARQRGKGIITFLANSFCVRRNGKYLKPIVDQSDIVCGNADEFTELYGLSGHQEAGKMFLKRTKGRKPQHKIVIMTMGPKGALVFFKGKYFFVPPTGVEVVDTTGAGDFFAGSMLYGLLNGWPVKKAGQFAVTLVGDIISHMGTLLSSDVRAKVDIIKSTS